MALTWQVGIHDELMDIPCSIVQGIFGLERAIVFNDVCLSAGFGVKIHGLRKRSV